MVDKDADATRLQRERLREWGKTAMRVRGLSASKWARLAGCAPSTVTRLLKTADEDPDAKWMPSLTTITKLERVVGMQAPIKAPDQSPGFGDPDVIPIEDGMSAHPRAASVPHRQVWEINSAALRLAGYLPGDQILVDTRERPVHGDVVIAQVYNVEHGYPETVMRLYQPPYLVAAGINTDQPPYMITQSVQVIGVVVESWRVRHKTA